MKKHLLMMIAMTACVLGLLTGCSSQEIAEVKSEAYESKDGWKANYNPDEFSMNEDSNGEVSFSLKADADGNNVVTVSYHKGKLPNEVLYDKTADIDDSRISRSEGWFGSTYPAWTYTRDIMRDEETGKGRTITGIEHNGGTLIIDIAYCWGDDEDTAMDRSDAIEGLVDSIELVDHKPQEEMAYKVGTYECNYQEEIEGKMETYTDTITLNEDHTGKISFQDDVDIIWSSNELIDRDGNWRYEYTVEGDTLLVNLHEGEEWRQFERKK